MRFSYYDRLSAKSQAIYRRSDEVGQIVLPHPELLRPFVGTLRAALAAEDRSGIQAASQFLSRGLTEMLEVVPVQVQVLAVRPRADWGELHGLYTQESGGACIRLWMRTAHHRRIVAFRTFLRTLLHEITHHLDYFHLNLGDSFHTEGFFKRETSLFRQIAPEEASAPRRRRPLPPP
jgi:hypothetical protein